jgi:hypothetical protein
MHCTADLAEIVGALKPAGLLTYRLHCRQQERDENRYDRHDDEQFDDRHADTSTERGAVQSHRKPMWFSDWAVHERSCRHSSAQTPPDRRKIRAQQHYDMPDA